MTVKSTHKTGLSREKWLELSIEVMRTGCESKFSLDSLLHAMPVGKGSFYWHFENREDFLNAIVDYWDRHDTLSVVSALENLPESATPADKLWELMCIVYEMRYARYDLMVRSLTLEFPHLRDGIAAVDQKRFDTVRALFSEIGFEGDELEMRSLIFVSVATMDQILLLDLDAEAYERQLRLRHEFFIRGGK